MAHACKTGSSTVSASSHSGAIAWSAIVFSAVIAVAAGIFLTPFPYGRAIWDFLFVLDGAYRIELGMVPHVDFSSPIGSFSLYLTHMSGWVFPEGNPFVGLHVLTWLTTLPIMAILASRFSSSRAFLAALTLLGIIMLVPITLDQTLLAEFSYFAAYNRFASGLLFLTGLWAVLRKSDHDWVLLAYIAVMLFFLKITALVAFLGIVGYVVVRGEVNSKRLIATAIFSLILTAIVNLAAPGLVWGYLADVAAMSALNSGGGLHGLAYSAFLRWDTLLLTAVLVISSIVLVPLPPTLAGGGVVSWARAFLEQNDVSACAGILVGAAWLAESQNSGGVGFVAAAALAFHPKAWAGPTRRNVIMALLMAAMLLPLIQTAFSRTLTVIIREGRPTVEHPIQDILPGTSVPETTLTASRFFERVNSEWLDFVKELEADGFMVERDPGSNAPGGMLAWFGSAAEAARIFKERGYDSASRYTTIAFADPFARTLNLKPAARTTIVHDVGRTVPLMGEDEAYSYLAGSDGVFFSHCERRTVDNNDASFLAVLGKEFQRLPLNECWDFFRRVVPAQPTGEDDAPFG